MKISANTKICASIAFPNKKTTAPIMHNAGFEEVDADLRYFAIEPNDIGEAISGVRSLGFEGISVSKPFKEEVIAYLDDVDAVAKSIGAVNVVHNVDGKLKGYNSDWIGAVGALEEKVEIEGKNIAVLGAGGASRALVYGLLLKGANVHVFNRSNERGQSLVEDIGANWGGNISDIFQCKKPDIIINATPLGRLDDTETPLPEYNFDGVELVMDINVRKSHSKLMLDAQSQGCEIIGGVRMLVLQGAFAFKLFSGKKAPVEVMEAAVLDAMS